MTANASGYSLTQSDIPIVLGMAKRGDRNHDIAAWFGVNQGRIAEAKDGSFGHFSPAAPSTLPPSGAPGIKGRRLRSSLDAAAADLQSGNSASALSRIMDAMKLYDADEP